MSHRLNTEVTAVTHSAAGVKVRTADGTEFTAGHAVVTVSLGLLRRRSIDIQPPLAAATQHAIDNTGWGTVERVWLNFAADVALPWTLFHSWF